MSSKAKKGKRKSFPQVQQYTLGQPFSAPASKPTAKVRVEAPSADGRRHHISEVAVSLPQVEYQALVASYTESFEVGDVEGYTIEPFDDGKDSEMSEEEDEDEEIFIPRCMRAQASSAPMKQWKLYSRQFLDELIASEGRGVDGKTCRLCNASLAENGVDGGYRCKVCLGGELLCKACIIKVHERNPFHAIQAWKDGFFQYTTLGDIGFALQLGHPPGESCGAPLLGHSEFLVVDINSVSRIRLKYCMCNGTYSDPWKQLLRYRLYPATTEQPRTAFTFRLLDLFHALTLKGKVSTYDFYHGMEWHVDSSGTRVLKGRYEAFLRIARQWRYLKMLKRRGIGNQPERDLDGLEEGELAVRCIACPLPGINLPDNWEDAPPDTSFIYNKFISLDACFRLKRRAVSSEVKDPGLMSGKAYFVPPDPYLQWVKDLPDQDENSSCPGLAAISQANNKFSKGYASTGVLLCLCSRHEIVEPTGTGDTLKGEKHGIGDYMCHSSQRRSGPKVKRFVSYDIACQWYKKFFIRALNLPDTVRPELLRSMWQFVVPKLHIRGHIRFCQMNFSFHLLLGVGNTDGEGIERHWASLGPVGTSTREMGPGNRRDTLDDHLGAWNWYKTITMGFVLWKKYWDAVRNAETQTREYEQFTESQGPHVDEWQGIVTDWESGVSERNPYEQPTTGPSMQEVRLQYAEKELEQQKAGAPRLHDVSPSGFMVMGLEVEDQQRSLRLDAKGSNLNTPLQKTDLLERRAKLDRNLAKFRTIQHVYLPLALEQLEQPTTNAASPNATENAENAALFLPSGLPASERILPSLKPYIDMEIEFRKAQLNTSIQGIRNHLYIRTRLNIQRSLHTRHQRASRGARDILARNDRKIEGFKGQYRDAWSAMANLVGPDHGYRQLLDSDVRSYVDRDIDAIKSTRKVLGKRDSEGRSRRQPDDALFEGGDSRAELSWIWTEVGDQEDSEALLDALRIEWSKAWARKRRWDEEVLLLKEEMERCKKTLAYEAVEWTNRAVVEGSEAYQEGAQAYARKQAWIRRALAARFVAQWTGKPYVRRLRSRPKRFVDLQMYQAEEEEEEEEEAGPD